MSKVSRGDSAAPAQFIFTSGAAPSPTLARALEPYFGQTVFA